MKNKAKQKLKSAVSILLMLAVVITGAFAYFTATDSKKNVFTLGDVDIVLHEDDWTEPDENGDSQHIDGDNINVLPGEKISKAPYIENTGDNNAWVYMTIGIPTIQRDTSRTDDLAISFTNTNIPVEAYALQEGYGNVDGSQTMWDTYFADKSDDKFGTAVTDETALLNRVELFNMPDLSSGWTQLGEAFKSEDGFNYYVFAYDDAIEPTAKTTPVIEWVQINPALTQSEDVLFSPDDTSVDYFVRKDIGESKAQEIYGVQADYEYAGAIEPDYVPEQDDAYYVSNANVLFTYNSTSSQWEAELLSNSADQDLIPDSIFNKTTVVIDIQGDPEPDHQKPECGDIYEDDTYIYMYGYGYDDIYSDSWHHVCDLPQYNHVLGWGVKVKDYTKSYYPPIKDEIYGEPVTGLFCTFNDCDNLIETPVLPKNTVYLVNTFSHCDNLTTVNYLPDSVIDMTSTFDECENLTDIQNIPKSLKYIDNAFDNCNKLKSLPSLPEGLETMYSGPLADMNSLSGEIIIPASVTYIDEKTFSSIETTNNLTIKYYSNNASVVEPIIDYYNRYADSMTKNITFLNIGEYKQ